MVPTQYQDVIEKRDRINTTYYVADDFDIYYINNKLLTYCATRNISCFDMTQRFIEENEHTYIHLPKNNGHWNVHGHDVAAQYVFENIY